MDRETVLNKIKGLVSEPEYAPKIIMQQVVDLLRDNFQPYNWVGIYLAEENELVLATWSGPEATEHTRIPIGKGICGAAAASGKTEVINDVSKDTRYLVCFSSTKSEIVVPIKKGNRIIGEIDIDSNELDAFNNTDTDFLGNVASLLSEVKVTQ